MNYTVKTQLETRGPSNPEPPSEVSGNLMVATEPVATFVSGRSRVGHDNTKLFPAFYNGKPAWLLRREWDPAPGYCASGTEEGILPLEEGVGILFQFNLWEHVFPKVP